MGHWRAELLEKANFIFSLGFKKMVNLVASLLKRKEIVMNNYFNKPPPVEKQKIASATVVDPKMATSKQRFHHQELHRNIIGKVLS